MDYYAVIVMQRRKGDIVSSTVNPILASNNNILYNTYFINTEAV